MSNKGFNALLDELRLLHDETEWVEFKLNYVNHQEIGEYISALSNGACLHNQEYGYLIYGIEDKTHNVIGTDFKPKQAKEGEEELENWLARLLDPRIDFRIHEVIYEDMPITILEIDATQNTPVKFKGAAYIRVGSYKKKLNDYPEKERKIWNKKAGKDWSSQICKGATINDLSPEAILKARGEYKQKNPHRAQDIDKWGDITFLNKAKITIRGQITNAAIILLGKEESAHFILPARAEISWILKDKYNIEKDYAHFGPPFILNIEKVFSKIRNITIRQLPDETLFPKEISQYDPWVIREALHNCIAHQDYELKGKVYVVETTERLIFTNVGSFIPGSIEQVIQQDAPTGIYRNPFLSGAMVALNMIDTIGSGIKRMFQTQQKRFFPMPDFDLSDNERIVVRIPGEILDEKYTRLLMRKTDLDLQTVILLDKVQKKVRISREKSVILKKQKLIEGRYPNLFVASKVASATGEKAAYIKNLAFDKEHYKKLIIAFIRKYGSASRQEIDSLLMTKLPDVLDEDQKRNKIHNLLYEMSGNVIKNLGSRRKSKWSLKS